MGEEYTEERDTPLMEAIKGCKLFKLLAVDGKEQEREDLIQEMKQIREEVKNG